MIKNKYNPAEEGEVKKMNLQEKKTGIENHPEVGPVLEEIIIEELAVDGICGIY